ncbi:MAG TPA: hypothetical protein VEJ20_01840 [Candidatus Eremiobacteraceae bacterium]|nr:hypothetical protein [Candidatus Eremiobacteraceae bacterium]
MRRTEKQGVGAVIAWLLAAVAAGCAHPLMSAIPGPSPTPSGGASVAPTASPSCAPQATGDVVFVAMSVLATATTDPTYGLIDGYAPLDDTGQFNDVASVITANPADQVQFENADDFGPTIIEHSAVGVPTPFPTPGYVFPAAAASPQGTAIVNGSLWSTGEIQPLCFSQTFTVSDGVYAFGDIQYYGSANMRDVLLVSESYPVVHDKRAVAPLSTRTPSNAPSWAISHDASLRP